jgi:hypothetical protein
VCAVGIWVLQLKCIGISGVPADADVPPVSPGSEVVVGGYAGYEVVRQIVQGRLWVESGLLLISRVVGGTVGGKSVLEGFFWRGGMTRCTVMVGLRRVETPGVADVVVVGSVGPTQPGFLLLRVCGT